MEGEERGQLTRLLWVSTVVAGSYAAYVWFTGPETAASSSNAETATQSATPDEPRSPTSDGKRGTLPVATPSKAAPAAPPRQTATLETDDLKATFTNVSTGLTQVSLKRERYRDESGRPMDVITTDRDEFRPFRLEVSGLPATAQTPWRVKRLSKRALEFSWEGDGYRVIRKVEAGQGPYQLWSTVRVTNVNGPAVPVQLSYGAHHYVTREDEKGGFFASRSPKLSQGICFHGDEVTRLDREDSLETEPGKPRRGFGPKVHFAGTENTFFAGVMAAHGPPAERCQITSSNRGGTADEPNGSLFNVRLLYPRVELQPGESRTYQTLGYFGPKDTDALRAAGHHLTEVVDLGWFSVVARYFVGLLRVMYNWLGNWGLAIIALTVLVRIALFPLTWKSFQSMARMRVLKPEMDRLNELYKDDPQKKGAAVMELYRKQGVSPLGGCLPSLLQMPVWFAFYASLSTNVELYHADFTLWWTDLSAPDPYFTLPLLLGGLMFLQQKLTPTTMDPTQARVMLYAMPIMITSFMLFLPAGLTLYMVTNSVLGIGQQQWIHRSLDRKQAQQAALNPAAEPDPASDSPSDAAEAPNDAPKSVVNRTRLRTKPKSRKATKRRTRRARS